MSTSNMYCNRACNTCNKEFAADSNIDDRKLHYKSEWHRNNLKRKVAGLEGITEDRFLAKLRETDYKLDETPMLYTCGLCCKSYKSPRAHAQHLTSKTHLLRASQGQIESAIILRPLMQHTRESNWEEAGFDQDSMNDVEYGCEEEFDPTRCFMCDFKSRTLETCMLHMHKKHGFFIPDIEYLKDPKGLLTYFGLKVTRDFLCLYCHERKHSFCSLEAVRKHIEAKCHCKVHDSVELDEFYDYSTRNMNKDGELLVARNGEKSVEFGHGGCELILKSTTDGEVSAKTLGYRKFLRYYKQNTVTTRPGLAIVALSSKFKSKGLSAMQPKKVKDMRLFNMHQTKIARSLGFPTMETKISFGLQNNIDSSTINYD